MVYKIIVGRDESDKLKFDDKGLIYIGKQYVKMGQTTSLSNPVYLDVARSHVVFVTGKRGGGKSYTLGVLAEEMINLPIEVKKNLSIIIFDTMGIFWTMKYGNEKERDLLEAWGLKSKKLNVDIYTPEGHFEDYKKREIPTDFSFNLKTSELNAGDWCNTFGVGLTSDIGVAIERIVNNTKEKCGASYGIKEIIQMLKKDKNVDHNVKNAVENRFLAADSWGLFSDEGTKIKDIVKGGKISIIDISCYSNVSGNWGIKSLVIGLIAKKLMNERVNSRKAEETKSIEKSQSLFFEDDEEGSMPLVWLFIDEAHEFLPKEGVTAATDALIQVLREGRQPGVSLVLASQQPGEIHKDVITQSDIVISHRLTAKKDIDALNDMMQSYLTRDILDYLNGLPRLKGSAIVLDDNSERIFPIRVRPRFTWHGGEAPTSVKLKKKSFLED